MAGALDLLRQIAMSVGPPAPSLPPGRMMMSEGDDSQDMLDDVEGPETTLPGELFVSYVDTNSLQSTRSITLRGVKRDEDGAVILRCFCHLRADMRTFRTAQIIEAVDIISGEPLTPPTNFLRYWGLTPAPRNAPDPTLAALKTARHGVVVLSFLSRCDGFQHPSEIEVIVKFLLQHGGGYTIDPTRLAAFLARMKPNTDLFSHSAEMLASGKGECGLDAVLHYAGMLIEADGVVHENEVHYTKELMKYVRRGT